MWPSLYKRLEDTPALYNPGVDSDKLVYNIMKNNDMNIRKRNNLKILLYYQYKYARGLATPVSLLYIQSKLIYKIRPHPRVRRFYGFSIYTSRFSVAQYDCIIRRYIWPKYYGFTYSIIHIPDVYYILEQYAAVNIYLYRGI